MYHFLASELINIGVVDVAACAGGGLTSDGAPNACGAEAARSAVIDWQNRFDEAILEAARQSAVPAFVVKAVIAKESQFWPGSIEGRDEYGLGHLTEQGADNTLLWNKGFYEAYCPAILGETYCGVGYSHQSDYRRAYLRGSLLGAVNADCPDCEWGIDFETAQEGVGVLVETLKAYCFQSGRMISNVTREAPGLGTSFEDLWKLTLASYAAGPGCVADALRIAWKKGELISWSSVANDLPEACSGAREYVDYIAR
jgi:hypothetical protein